MCYLSQHRGCPSHYKAIVNNLQPTSVALNAIVFWIMDSCVEFVPYGDQIIKMKIPKYTFERQPAQDVHV
eukprot:3037898-Karenia_brevis.AAC.1